MSKYKKYGVTIMDDNAVALIDKIAPWLSPTTTVAELAQWAAKTIERTARDESAKFDKDEKRAMIGAVNGWFTEPWTGIKGDDFATEIEDFLTIGNGAAWGWSADKVATLAKKLKGLGPLESLAMLVWSKRAWAFEGGVEAYLEGNSKTKH